MALTEEQRAKLNAKAQQKQSGFSQNDYDEYQEFLRFKEMKQQQAQYQQETYQQVQYTQPMNQNPPLQNNFEQPVQQPVAPKVGKDGLTTQQRIKGWGLFFLLLASVLVILRLGTPSKTQSSSRNQQQVVSQQPTSADRTQTGNNNTTTIGDASQRDQNRSEEQNVVSEVEPSVAEEQPMNPVAMTMSEQEFRASCQELDYKQIARNPNAFIGQNFKVKVKVWSVVKGGLFSGYDKYYKAAMKSDMGSLSEYMTEDYYFGDMIYLIDEQDPNNPSHLNILEDDVIVAYGTFQGMIPTSNALNGTNSEDIGLYIYYADLISE